MKGTAAAGKIHAKTGTMTAVSAISGYASTEDGEMLAFAIGINNFTGPGKAVESLQDKALELLAGFSRK
jgi:D-alanyl-D-alanine carboxypeptidase/D-alanyl-D-alanine-endopeptidase (penicillin-binding protein 4)